MAYVVILLTVEAYKPSETMLSQPLYLWKLGKKNPYQSMNWLLPLWSVL